MIIEPDDGLSVANWTIIVQSVTTKQEANMSEFVVGETIDHKALGEFSSLLRAAYDNGKADSAHMDWDDVAAALEKAIEAFGEDGRAFEAAANEGFDVEPVVTYPMGASWEVRAAVALLFAYRYPDDVEWEDVDMAWEILLQSNVERGMRPTEETT
jgi:hypothetical protein